MKSLRMLSLVLLCLSGALTASAQGLATLPAERYEQTRADLNFVFAFPQGDFADRLDETPVGVAAFLGGRIPNSPFVLGTELTYLNYGTNQRLELFEYEGFPVEVVGIGTTNNIAMGHLVARLQPATGAIQPFVDLLGGLRYFNTRTRLQSDVILFRNGLSGSATSGDWAFSYGAGAGLDLNLYTGSMGFDGREGSVGLNVGVRYLFGEEAEYAGEFRPAGGGVTYDLLSSDTDMIQPQVGLRVKM